MAKTTAAERKAAERARREQEGLTRFEAYVHPDDHVALRLTIKRLAKKRCNKRHLPR